jgi:hypothetical protein
MKTLDTKQVMLSVNGRVHCPHCDGPQDDLDEYNAKDVYECENCWNHYTMPKEVIEAELRRKQGDPIMAELRRLEKRLERLEKELGIKR